MDDQGPAVRLTADQASILEKANNCWWENRSKHLGVEPTADLKVLVDAMFLRPVRGGGFTITPMGRAWLEQYRRSGIRGATAR